VLNHSSKIEPISSRARNAIICVFLLEKIKAKICRNTLNLRNEPFETKGIQMETMETESAQLRMVMDEQFVRDRGWHPIPQEKASVPRPGNQFATCSSAKKPLMLSNKQSKFQKLSSFHKPKSAQERLDSTRDISGARFGGK
jgi:hypothetical protein